VAAKIAARAYVITNSPSDVPGLFVVRGWDIDDLLLWHPDPGAVAFASIEAARGYIKALGRGMVQCPRKLEDDPVIVETWAIEGLFERLEQARRG
jgi:hypothetical protein